MYDVFTSVMSRVVPKPCVCATFRRASRILSRTYDARLAKHGFSASELAVVGAILRHPGEPIARVADDLAMDRTSLYRMLAPLEQRGWVRIERGRDARARTVRLTAAGLKAQDAVSPEWAALQTSIVGDFGRARWRALLRELQALIDVVPNVAGEPG